MNAVEIEEAISEFSEQSFDDQEYTYAFLDSFGKKAMVPKRFLSNASNRPRIGGIRQAQNILIASFGQNDITATMTALKASPSTAKANAKFVMATHGNEFEAGDLNIVEITACACKPFKDHVGSFKSLITKRS